MIKASINLLHTMKQILLFLFFGGIFCADLGHFHGHHQVDFGRQLAESTSGAQVVTDEREGPVGANFKYRLEQDDGTIIEQEGTPGAAGTSVIRGSYSFQTPEGETIQISYVADENGFRPESPILPELPQFVQDQITFAAQQRSNTPQEPQFNSAPIDDSQFGRQLSSSSSFGLSSSNQPHLLHNSRRFSSF